MFLLECEQVDGMALILMKVIDDSLEADEKGTAIIST
jgi:hypothetical protein